MDKLKWLLPVVIGIVVLAFFWWMFHERSYSPKDLIGRDNSAVILILADMDEKRLVGLRQELLKLRGNPSNPPNSAELERIYTLTTNAIRMRGIDERKLSK